MIRSQLYGRARDICRSISDAKNQPAIGWKKIVEAVYKHDTLSVSSKVYQSYLEVLTTKRRSNGTFRKVKSSIRAHISKFNSTTTSCKTSAPLMAFTLLFNSSVDNNHTISVLTGSSNGNSLGSYATTDVFYS